MSHDSQLLSEREIEILELVSTGMTNQQIALELDISANTVKAHLRNIFGKIEVESRTEATRYAIAHQLVTIRGLEVPPAEKDEAPPAPDALAAYQAMVPLWQPLSALILALLAALVVGLWPRAGAREASSVGDFSDGARTDGSAPLQALPRWETAAALPAPRSRFAQAVVGGQLFLIAGETDLGLTDRVDAHDFASGAWEQRAAKPTAVANVKAAVIGERIYVPGGLAGDGRPTNLLEVYDPASDSWSAGASLPRPLFGYALIGDEAGFWIAGGWDGARYVAETYYYRAADDAWETGPPLSVARGFAAGALLEGQAYVTGGYDGVTVYRLCEALVTGGERATWQVRAPMHAPRAGHEAVALEGGLYVIGGGWDRSLDYAERYDRLSNAWATFATPVIGPWRNLGLSAVSGGRGGLLYAVGGWNDGYLASVQTYQATYRLYLTVEKGETDG